MVKNVAICGCSTVKFVRLQDHLSSSGMIQKQNRRIHMPITRQHIGGTEKRKILWIENNSIYIQNRSSNGVQHYGDILRRHLYFRLLHQDVSACHDVGRDDPDASALPTMVDRDVLIVCVDKYNMVYGRKRTVSNIQKISCHLQEFRCRDSGSANP